MTTLSEMLEEYQEDHMIEDVEIHVAFWRVRKFEKSRVFLDLAANEIKTGLIYTKYSFLGLTKAEIKALIPAEFAEA